MCELSFRTFGNGRPSKYRVLQADDDQVWRGIKCRNYGVRVVS